MTPEDTLVEWGARIAAARQQAGLSQAGLARVMGRTQQEIARWELGVREPSLAVRLEFAAAFGCAHDDLFPAP